MSYTDARGPDARVQTPRPLGPYETRYEIRRGYDDFPSPAARASVEPLLFAPREKRSAEVR